MVFVVKSHVREVSPPVINTVFVILEKYMAVQDYSSSVRVGTIKLHSHRVNVVQRGAQRTVN